MLLVSAATFDHGNIYRFSFCY